jgi:hypothetical protein
VIVMNKLFDLVTSQITSFNQSIGPGHEVALLFPGMGNRYFFPSAADDYNPHVVVLHGELDSGEKSQAVFDNASFPLVLVAVPKPPDRLKREFHLPKHTVKH